jgi:hypothetical protein
MSISLLLMARCGLARHRVSSVARELPYSCDTLPRDEVRICTVRFGLPGSEW